MIEIIWIKITMMFAGIYIFNITDGVTEGYHWRNPKSGAGWKKPLIDGKSYHGWQLYKNVGIVLIGGAAAPTWQIFVGFLGAWNFSVYFRQRFMNKAQHDTWLKSRKGGTFHMKPFPSYTIPGLWFWFFARLVLGATVALWGVMQ